MLFGIEAGHLVTIVTAFLALVGVVYTANSSVRSAKARAISDESIAEELRRLREVVEKDLQKEISTLGTDLRDVRKSLDESRRELAVILDRGALCDSGSHRAP